MTTFPTLTDANGNDVKPIWFTDREGGDFIDISKYCDGDTFAAVGFENGKIYDSILVRFGLPGWR